MAFLNRSYLLRKFFQEITVKNEEKRNKVGQKMVNFLFFQI
jgi:hypothetical protein